MSKRPLVDKSYPPKSSSPQIGHFGQKTSFFPLLLFISQRQNNFTAVKPPVLIHIISIHQKMEKKLGVTMLIFLPHPHK